MGPSRRLASEGNPNHLRFFCIFGTFASVLLPGTKDAFLTSPRPRPANRPAGDPDWPENTILLVLELARSPGPSPSKDSRPIQKPPEKTTSTKAIGIMEKAAPALFRPAPGRTDAPRTPSSRNRMTAWKRYLGPFPAAPAPRVARKLPKRLLPRRQTRMPIFFRRCGGSAPRYSPQASSDETSTFERLVVTLTFVIRARKASTGKPLASCCPRPPRHFSRHGI
jgi:hypothetical protein